MAANIAFSSGGPPRIVVSASIHAWIVYDVPLNHPPIPVNEDPVKFVSAVRLFYC